MDDFLKIRQADEQLKQMTVRAYLFAQDLFLKCKLITRKCSYHIENTKKLIKKREILFTMIYYRFLRLRLFEGAVSL